MGMAGREEAAPQLRSSHVDKAETYIDRAAARKCLHVCSAVLPYTAADVSCVTVYHDIEDVRGECEMIAKKAIIARLRGDGQMANLCAERYLALHRRAVEGVVNGGNTGDDSEG